jgi:hypothetical protein
VPVCKLVPLALIVLVEFDEPDTVAVSE